MRTRRSRTILAVAILAVCLAGYFYVATRFRQVELVLSDGSSITLEELNYGKTHYRQGKSWGRLAGWLPPEWQKRFSIRPLVGRSEPTLLAYFSHQPISQNLEFAVADENGFYAARSSGVILQSTDFPENIEVLGREFPVFPRRGNYFFLNVYSNRHEGGLEKLGQWKLRNPARQEYPIWKGEPVPIHRSVDGMDFILTRLLLRKPLPTNRFPGEAAFVIKEEGEISTNWVIHRVDLEDATGNKAVTGREAPSELDQDGRFVFRLRPLFPDGSAWKMRVEFVRNANGPFPPEEWITFTNVPVSSAGVEVGRIFGGEGDSVTVRLNPEGAGAARRLVARVQAGVRNHVVLLRATDEAGCDLEGRSVSRDGNWEHEIWIEHREGMRRVNLTFAVHGSRFAEYLVVPTVAEKAPTTE